MTLLTAEDDGMETTEVYSMADDPLSFVQTLVHAFVQGNPRMPEDEIIERSFSLARRVYDEGEKHSWGSWRRPGAHSQ